MNNPLVIRPATMGEFATAIEWAGNEGWNPGLDDLDVFHACDRNGFLMGWMGGAPVSSISVVRYGNDFGFLGFYIVHPSYRGTGVGIATWHAGIDYLEGRAIALDGVIDQQANYKKSGFVYVGRNVRFSGAPKTRSDAGGGISVRSIVLEDMPAVLELDRMCFGTARNSFTRAWCLPKPPARRQSFVCLKDRKVTGFATIRTCRSGYKIGPLFCKEPGAANALFNALIATVKPGSDVSIDVPASKSEAIGLATRAGLKPVFEAARMMRGTGPEIDGNSVYGITSFELG